MVIQVQKDFRALNRQDQKKNSPHHFTIKTISIQNKERISKADRRKYHIIYSSKPIKIIADFSTEVLEAKRA
jgi:hypothetical protein